MPFSYSMSRPVRSSTLFALVKSKGIALMSIIGLGIPGRALLIDQLGRSHDGV